MLLHAWMREYGRRIICIKLWFSVAANGVAGQSRKRGLRLEQSAPLATSDCTKDNKAPQGHRNGHILGISYWQPNASS
jgi:hypothetical protein